jgi:hypothetical protein
MAARYETITYQEMREFLESFRLDEGHRQGFSQIKVPDTREFVFSKGVKGWDFGNDKLRVAIRVYTSIDIALGISRDNGQDAIRVTAWARRNETAPFMLHGTKRVHRVKGWRDNLAERLNAWRELLGQPCPTCGCPMFIKHNRKSGEPFWGCVRYPNCLGVRACECDHSAASKRSVTCPDCGINLKEKRSPII